MTPASPTASVVLTVGRLLLAAIFILEGWSKVRGYDAAVAYMSRFRVRGCCCRPSSRWRSWAE